MFEKSVRCVTLADIIQLPGILWSSPICCFKRWFPEQMRVTSFLCHKVWPFSYPIFTFFFERVHQNLKELGDLTTVPVSRGTCLFLDDERIPNSRRSECWVLSQFEFLKIRDFQKKSPTLYTTQIGFQWASENPGALSEMLCPQELKSLVGTPQYWAPEMLLGRGRRLRWMERFC